MATSSDFTTLFSDTRYSALQAELGQNYAEALRLWQVLEGYIATMPDQERSGVSMNWRNDIATHINRLEKLVAGARGIQQQRIEYRNPRPC